MGKSWNHTPDPDKRTKKRKNALKRKQNKKYSKRDYDEFIFEYETETEIHKERN